MERIRRAVSSDAARLTEIAHAAKRHWGYREAWIVAWREQLTVTPAYVGERHVELIEVNGTPTGFFALAEHADFAELEHLWVDPPLIGRGLGRRLLERAGEVCQARRLDRIEIDSDPHAEPFYLRLGARRVGWTRAPVEGDSRRQLPRLRLDVGPADAD